MVGTMLRTVETHVFNTWKWWVSTMLPYQPMDGDKDLLDAEYSAGVWDYLRELNELARFSVVVGYCHYFKDKGAILEIGCGEGILQERLCPLKYSRFVGVDISAKAIKQASQKQDHKNLFIREDARTWNPTERFDLIVFNECLEYFDDPLGLVKRYEQFLQENGIYIVSMFVGRDTSRTKRIWRTLESVYAVEAETRVTTEPGYTWVVKVFTPAKCKTGT